MVFIGKVNNYMFRPKAAILKLSQLQFQFRDTKTTDKYR